MKTIGNEFDYILVGKSFLSFVLGESLLEKGNRVLILDDNRLGYGDVYLGYLSELEKNYLKKWGEIYQVEPLIHLDRYLKQTNYHLIVENSWLKLGRSPLFNYQEMTRKYPKLFSKKGLSPWNLKKTELERFNDQVLEFIDRMANLLLSQHKLTPESLLAQAPNIIKEIYSNLKNLGKKFEEFGDWQEKTLFYTAKGLFQNKLSLYHSDLDWLHLMLSMLSPFYRVDHRSLQNDLEEVFHRRGGIVKRTNLADIQYEKSKPWAFELESFEGVVRPHNVILMGGLPLGLDLKLLPEFNVYQSVDVQWKFETPVDHTPDMGVFIFADREKIGTNRPWWLAEFLPNEIKFKIFHNFEHGQKVEFFKKEISHFVRDSFYQAFPHYKNIPYQEKMNIGQEIFLRADNLFTGQIKNYKTAIINMAPDSGHRPLKNTLYIGPYNNGPLGLLSSLVDIHDFAP